MTKPTKNEIGKCETCGQAVPTVFIKDCGIAGHLCHPCYSEGARKGKWDYPFFGFKTTGEVARLRRTVPKFPERFLTRHDVDSPEWANDFTEFCSKKASWYGFKDVFEFFGKCLED